ncbi:MAG: preprotein translocase subunit SecE [Christensenellales bacterium]|jgi:preprotein translocase subunit SecE
MAKTAAGAKDSKKPNLLKRFLMFWANLFLGIARAFKNTYYELKKVTWPTRRDLINYSTITLGFMVFMGIIIYLIDLGSGALVDLLLSIGA